MVTKTLVIANRVRVKIRVRINIRISGDVYYPYFPLLTLTYGLGRVLIFILTLIFTLSLTAVILTLFAITSVLVTMPMAAVTIIILEPYY